MRRSAFSTYSSDFPLRSRPPADMKRTLPNTFRSVQSLSC
jgi:hypothetical protein